MGVFVVVTTSFCVVAPRLSNPQINLVLGIVNLRKIIRYARLNEIPQFGHRIMAQNRIVDRGNIAHVGSSFLALDEISLFVGQITV